MPIAASRTTRYHAPRAFPAAQPPFPRIAYSAAHVVADPLASADPWVTPAIDWDRTIAYRKYLWSLGLGVAEAMDTAQRGMGLDWNASLELIRRALDAARDVPGAIIACGAGTDHLAPSPAVTVDDVIRAYEEQCEAVEKLGGRIILMASRALAACAKSPDDYLRVYARILGGVRQPVIIHWLGEMFDPALDGYWGHADHMAAMETCLAMLHANAAKVDGIKISLLDKDKEITMRRRLPAGCACIRATISTMPSSSPATNRAIRTRCSAFSTRSHPPRRPRSAASSGTTSRPSTTSSRRPSRSRATSSRRRHGSTRPASCSWPG